MYPLSVCLPRVRAGIGDQRFSFHRLDIDNLLIFYCVKCNWKFCSASKIDINLFSLSLSLILLIYIHIYDINIREEFSISLKINIILAISVKRTLERSIFLLTIYEHGKWFKVSFFRDSLRLSWNASMGHRHLSNDWLTSDQYEWYNRGEARLLGSRLDLQNDRWCVLTETGIRIVCTYYNVWHTQITVQISEAFPGRLWFLWDTHYGYWDAHAASDAALICVVKRKTTFSKCFLIMCIWIEKQKKSNLTTLSNLSRYTYIILYFWLEQTHFKNGEW